MECGLKTWAMSAAPQHILVLDDSNNLAKEITTKTLSHYIGITGASDVWSVVYNSCSPLGKSFRYGCNKGQSCGYSAKDISI